jgi:hypothetical protein
MLKLLKFKFILIRVSVTVPGVRSSGKCGNFCLFLVQYLTRPRPPINVASRQHSMAVLTFQRKMLKNMKIINKE